jgi:preprotein translocase subunit YajC
MNTQILLMVGAQGGGAGGNSILGFLPFILMFVIIYFLIIRPQNKKQKDLEKMRSSVKKGDKIITNGGIHAVVEGVKDNNVLLIKTASDTKLHIDKTAIASVKTEK